MNKQSSVRTILSLVLAVGIALCASGLTSLFSLSGAMAYMLVFIVPMLGMFLFGFGGILPAAVMLSTLEIATYFTLGGVWMLIMIPAAVIPCAEMIYLSYKGVAFFKQLRYALITQALGLVALLAAAYAYFQTDIGTVVAESMRASLAQMPEEIQSFLASTFRQMFEQSGEMLPQTDAEVLKIFFDEYEQVLKLSLPTFIVILVVLNAGGGVIWGNYLRVRHGEPNACFEGSGKWHMTTSTVLGLTFSVIATAILMKIWPEDWTMVFSVMLSVASIACLVQAMDSLLFRMRVAGVGRGKRRAIAIIVFLFMNVYLVPYGVMSAFFGSQGIFTKLLKARAEKMRQDKEE